MNEKKPLTIFIPIRYIFIVQPFELLFLEHTCNINSHILCDILLFSDLLCQYCKGKVEIITEDLLLHSKLCSCAPRPDRDFTFVCLFCDYHTYKSHHMRGHIRSHTGDKPYGCKFCEYCSANKSHITRHIKRMHPSFVSFHLENVEVE